MNILNLGCGDEEYGTHRVDINPTKTSTHVFDVEDGIQFPDNTFGIVRSRNLLEHLKNVGFHLSECFRVMEPGGKITVITDNAECLRYYWFGTHTGNYEKQHESNDKHYGLFTKSHLYNHFKAAKFRNIDIKYVGTDTSGRYFDALTLSLLGHPRIQVNAVK